jgi:hypothetical protein
MAVDEAGCRAISKSMLLAATSADSALIEAIYPPGARIWHNITNRISTMGEAAAAFAAMAGDLRNLRYEDVRLEAFEGGFVQQHCLLGDLDGRELRIDACIVCYVRDGQIIKTFEYFDSAALSRIGLTLG